MHAIKRATTALVATTVLAGGVLTAAPAAVASDICSYKVTRSYKPTSSSWFKIRGKHVGAVGTVDNRRSDAQVAESVKMEVSGTLKASVTAAVGGKATILVAEINKQLETSVEASWTITAGKQVTVTVPARKRVKYTVGILKRTFKVTQTHRYSTCKTKKVEGTVTAADPYTLVRNY